MRFCALLGAAVLCAPTAIAQTLDSTEQAIVGYVDAQAEEAVAFLERVVNINSGTMNSQGVREVGRAFGEAFAGIGMDTQWVEMPPGMNRAGHLFAEQQGGKGKRLLLIGHLDTVFEEDSPFQRWVRRDSVAEGPGTEDMKGGNVVVLYALKALQAAGVLQDTRIIVAFTGDEEDTGDPLEVARASLIDAARRSDVALGFEGGVGHMNTATIARRGFTGWDLEVTGVRGHSSLIFNEQYGSGAIFEAARILAAFYGELAGEEYLTFGGGVILGGTDVEFDAELSRGRAFGKTNVIPQRVVVAGDLRTLTIEQRDRAKQRMQEIVSRHLPGTSATIRFRDSYPPMAPTDGNKALFDQLDQASRDLGFGPMEMVDPGRRGAADVSFVAPYVDGLDGLGLLGEGGHSPEELVYLNSMSVMTKRAAVLIYRLTKGEE
jgi:glutamate carboxypeptidase